MFSFFNANCFPQKTAGHKGLEGLDTESIAAREKTKLFEKGVADAKGTEVERARKEELANMKTSASTDKRKLFEQKQQEANEVKTAAGKQLDGIQSGAGDKVSRGSASNLVPIF